MPLNTRSHGVQHPERMELPPGMEPRELDPLLDQLPGVAFRMQADGSLDFISSGVEELLGHPPSDFYEGRFAFNAFIGEADLPKVQSARDGARAQGETYAVSYTIFGAGNQPIRISERGVGARDAANPDGMIQAYLTETEALTAASPSKGRGCMACLDDIPAYIWRATPDGQYHQFNAAWEQFTGLSGDRSPLWLDQVHPEDRDDLVSQHERCFHDHRAYETTYRMRDRAGVYRWLREIGSVLHDENGAISGFQGHATDLTEWKEAKEQLHASEVRSLTLSEMSPVGIFRTDREGNCLYTNQRWSELTQIPSQDAKGKGWTRCIHPDDREAFVEEWSRFAKTGATFNLQYRLTHPNGSILCVLGQARPERDGDGEIVGCVGTLTDLTERHRMEQEQLKLSKLESLGILAGGIAHDFNNQLTPIILNLSFALENDNLDLETVERLTEAQQAANEACHLTRQLLTFAKGGEPLTQTVELPGLLRHSMNFALRGTAVSGELAIDEGLWPVNVDRGQLSQVIQNLVINASQAMPGGGMVTIAAENTYALRHPSLPKKDGQFVHLTVTDTGVGMAPENLEHIFDPYFSTKPEGHGLGLASSLSIIRKHHGEIGVVSEPGKGTTFSIFLPASDGYVESSEEDSLMETQAYATIAPEVSPAQARARRVLIMDDELLIRTSTSLLLKKFGYETYTAANGREAIDTYKRLMGTEEAIDMVLMDLTIPGGMGGKDAIAALKNLDPKAKAIVISGYSHDSVIAHHVDHGFCGALQKPFQPQQLVRTLEQHLR